MSNTFTLEQIVSAIEAYLATWPDFAAGQSGYRGARVASLTKIFALLGCVVWLAHITPTNNVPGALADLYFQQSNDGSVYLLLTQDYEPYRPATDAFPIVAPDACAALSPATAALARIVTACRTYYEHATRILFPESLRALLPVLRDALEENDDQYSRKTINCLRAVLEEERIDHENTIHAALEAALTLV